MKKKYCNKCKEKKTSKGTCFFCVTGNERCRYCHSTNNLTKDHIVPKSRGGKNSRKNYQTLCGECNQTKGALTEVEIDIIFRDIKKRGIWYDWEITFEKMLYRIESRRKEPLNW